MRGFVAGTVCGAILTACVGVGAQGVFVHNGFMTGQRYRELTEPAKRGYAMGFIDGIYVSPLFATPTTRMAAFSKCITEMTDEQVAAMFSKTVADAPAEWHKQLHMQVFVTLIEACRLQLPPK